MDLDLWSSFTTFYLVFKMTFAFSLRERSDKCFPSMLGLGARFSVAHPVK